DWMDDALVEHAEDQVDHKERCKYEDRRALEGSSERLRIALEAGLQRQRRLQVLLNRLYIADRLADSGARGGNERNCHGRELIRMVDYKRRDLHHGVDQSGYRHLLSAG